MRVIETLQIGGRKQLVLVSCAGERFLVGTGHESVQTIVHVRAAEGAPSVSSKLTQWPNQPTQQRGEDR